MPNLFGKIILSFLILSELAKSEIISSDSESFLREFSSFVKINSNFLIFWKFHDNETITMAFKWRANGYFSLGFGGSMNNIDIISAELIGNEIVLSDRWSRTRKFPKRDDELGGQNDLIRLGYILNDTDGFSLVKFNRKLDTNDKFDYVIKQQRETFCYAYSDEKNLTYHGSNRNTFTFDFIEGSENENKVVNMELVNFIHCIGLTTFWSFFIDIAIGAKRYFKEWKYSLKFHIFLSSSINIYTFFAVLSMVFFNFQKIIDFEMSLNVLLHFIMGCILLSSLITQILVGYAIYYKIQPKYRKNFKLFHQKLGLIIYIFSKFTVLCGAYLYDPNLFLVLTLYYVCLTIFCIYSESLNNIKYKEEKEMKPL